MMGIKISKHNQKYILDSTGTNKIPSDVPFSFATLSVMRRANQSAE